jgi:hypothetical protein
MKRLAIALLVVMACGCGAIKETVKNSDFYYFGVNTKTFKEANYWKVGLGGLTSFGVHIGAHWIYNGLYDMGGEQNGFLEVTDGNCESQKVREFDQVGFAAQNGVGFILTSIPYTRQSDFTKGYVVAAFAETSSYILWSGDHGDFNMSASHGGNRDWEYAINLFVATHNMLRVNWYKD